MNSRIKDPIHFPIRDASDISPTPYVNPVIKRRVLLLSLFIKAWVSPSTIVGKIKMKVHNHERYIRSNTKNGILKNPMYVPVQRAHTGNCLPL